ncbi:TraR/DksA C4-type zinc finger protein [Sideroxydans lithotrophicus]|uniref:Transcriptional regulator, TraR/DksA family n=1 Tax=Sideroxydans lithotrophicus (strain ES-1) TaxID=580332 RepID=D5CUC6_SIDLE|nr:TraR/DksA C4-type zinc finger protein [Sideroxydans lithotrophicus]ADE10461.1 transcriptional regulator, TraR/DksA family [Sideroxydans lithotrophicus ES-1]
MRPEDRAQELELNEWEARQQAAIQPEPTRESAKWCKAAGCGERIPEDRRNAVPGVQFCIECQERNEFMGKER